MGLVRAVAGVGSTTSHRARPAGTSDHAACCPTPQVRWNCLHPERLDATNSLAATQECDLMPRDWDGPDNGWFGWFTTSLVSARGLLCQADAVLSGAAMAAPAPWFRASPPPLCCAVPQHRLVRVQVRVRPQELLCVEG